MADDKKKLFRLIDANLNRTKEGLRVCEDVCRFVLDDQPLTRQWKDLRHKVTENARTLPYRKIVEARDIERDVGKPSSVTELKRKDASDILMANMQRVKESVRVLEEFGKLNQKVQTDDFKKIRYKVYALEKKIVRRL